MIKSNLMGGRERNTRTRCDILDLRDPDSSWAGTEDEEGCRWLVVCEQHGSLGSVPTLSMARWLTAHPEEFCQEEGCG